MGNFETNRKIEGFVDDRNVTTTAHPVRRDERIRSAKIVRMHSGFWNFGLRDDHVPIIRSGVTSRWEDSL